MPRTEAEIISEVRDFCQVPRKVTHVKRWCGLDTRLFNKMVKKNVIAFHHEKRDMGRYGSHYYIANSDAEEK